MDTTNRDRLFEQLLNTHTIVSDNIEQETQVSSFGEGQIFMIKLQLYIENELKNLLYVENKTDIPYSIITPSGTIETSSKQEQKAIHPDCNLYIYDPVRGQERVNIGCIKGYNESARKMTAKYVIEILDSRYRRPSHDIQN